MHPAERFHDYLSFTNQKVQNPAPFSHVSRDVGKKGDLVMLQRFALSAFVVGTLLTASIPVAGFAQSHGGRSGGGYSSGRSAPGNRNSGQSFSGGSHNYAQRGFSG